MAKYASREAFEQAVVKNVAKWLRSEARRYKIKTDNVDTYAKRLVTENQDIVTKGWRDGNPVMQGVEGAQVTITFKIPIDTLIQELEK